MAATRINKGGCGMQPFVVICQHFSVAGRNFEEILQHLKERTRKISSTGKAKSDSGGRVSSHSCLAKIL